MNRCTPEAPPPALGPQSLNGRCAMTNGARRIIGEIEGREIARKLDCRRVTRPRGFFRGGECAHVLPTGSNASNPPSARNLTDANKGL